jgi:hypothetical protein
LPVNSVSFPKWLTRLSISQIWNTFKFLVHKSHSIKHNNNRGSADEHKTAFVCFVCKGINMTIISECFENINQTGHAKTLTHQTRWCYWDRCGIQHSVCLPNVHPSFTSPPQKKSACAHTHTKLKLIQLLTTCQTYHCIEKTCDLLPPLFYHISLCILSKRLNEHLLCCQTFLLSSSTDIIMLSHNWIHSLVVYYQCTIKELNIDSDPSHTCLFHLVQGLSFRDTRCYWQLVCSITHHWHCKCGIWMTSSMHKYHPTLLAFLNPSINVNLQHPTALQD